MARRFGYSRRRRTARLASVRRWNAGIHLELIVPVQYVYGQIAEARGDKAAAREHYGRFVRWWRDCDPELRPWWEQGRQALARVTLEPREGPSSP